MNKTSKILLIILVFALVLAVFVACTDPSTCQHEYVDGVCTKCGQAEPQAPDCQHNWVNGVCSKCNTACKHNFVNDVCSVCGINDPNAPHALVWTGVGESASVTIAVGDKYDVLEGVTVRDRKHGDLTSKIVVLNETDHADILEDKGLYDDFEAFNYNVANTYTVYYMVTCDKDGGISEIKDREIVVTQQHNVANGDFLLHNKNGFSGWQLDKPGASDVTMEQIEEDGLTLPKFTFPTTTGNGWWSVQFINKANLVVGKTYRIAITAKSATGKAVAFGFEDPTDGYAMVSGCTAFALKSEYETYYSYVTPSKDYSNAKAVLYMGYLLDNDEVGENAHEVIVKDIDITVADVCPDVQFSGLDNVSLKVGDDPFDPLQGVTASQGETNITSKIQVAGSVPVGVLERTNYVLAYYIPNENGKIALGLRNVSVAIEKEHDWDILNNEFNQGIFGDRYWTRDVNAGAGGSITVNKVDDGVEITINEPASADWHIQLRQDVALARGEIYDLEVRAKSSVNRSISVEFSGATKWGMDLTQEFKVFEYTYAGTGDSNKRLSFLLGGGGSECRGSTIVIDYIKIKLSADQTQYAEYQLKNSSFANGTKFWSKESADNYVAGTDETRSSIVLTTGIHGEDWRSQLFQTGLNFEANKTYKVKAVVKADQAGVFRIEGNGLFDKKEWTLVANEETTCEFTVTTTEARNNIRIGALMGELPEGTNLTFYTFEITEVTETPAE